MGLKRRQFTREIKLQVIREVEAGKAVAQVAREYQVHATQGGKWRQFQRRDAEEAFAGNGRPYQDEAKIAEVERMVGQLTRENALLKKALLQLEGTPAPPHKSGGHG